MLTMRSLGQWLLHQASPLDGGSEPEPREQSWWGGDPQLCQEYHWAQTGIWALEREWWQDPLQTAEPGHPLKVWGEGERYAAGRMKGPDTSRERGPMSSESPNSVQSHLASVFKYRFLALVPQYS